MIHSTAIIDPRARLHPSVRVGPYAVIDAAVELGADCVVGPHVYITGHTTIGERNRFYAGCVIGEAPQDLKYRDEPTRVRIGDDNVFREHVTVHRANSVKEDTAIGSNNFLMQHSHVAHNCTVGNYVIMASGAILGGHATVFDRAFISGNCLVHQFTRVGTLAMMQGGSAISKDLAPYTIAFGGNDMCGLNVVGLRRAGMSAAERLELRKLYHHLFLGGSAFREAVASAAARFSSPASQVMLEFIRSSKRGVCFHSHRRAGLASADE